MQRLELLKTLGDNTRYAIYLEIARSPSPCTTAEIADSLGLHPNTVRPHLERMREVGLLAFEIDGRGSVGRPLHRYQLADDAPSMGLEPPAFPTLASMLAAVAAQSVPASDDIVEVGRAQGRMAATRSPATRSRHESTGCVSALLGELDKLGFDPTVDHLLVGSSNTTVVAFAHCPYRELAEAYPQLVCQLHRGIIEGFVQQFTDLNRGLALDGVMTGADVEWFHTLVDREPCQVGLTAR
jgi:predicted ArsR family transcriptional regulator